MTRSFRDYRAYGLRVRSPIDLPFAPLPGSPSREADVRIVFGKTPTALPNPVAKRRAKFDWQCEWEAAKGIFLVNVPGVARYLVTSGRDVVISPYDECSDHDIGVFLMGRVFVALLQQRGFTTFHASGIATETGTVLFMGPSCIGKSSLVAALINRGYLMVTDDLASVTSAADGRLTILPSFPCTRLLENTLDMVGWRECKRTKVQEESKKYLVPVERFQPSPMPLRAVYILTYGDTQDVRIERLPISHAFKWLYKCIYRKRILYGLGQQGQPFPILAAISKEIPVSLVERPWNSYLLGMQVDHILADLHGESLPAGNDAAAKQAVSRSVA